MPLKLDTPVQFLKGVGPKLGDILSKKGIRSIEDLICTYPRTYEDRRAVRSISSLEPGQMVSLSAFVISVRSFQMGRSRRKIYEVIIGDSTGKIACKYFRIPYKGYFNTFEPNMSVRVVGKVTNYRGRLEFHHPDVHPVQAGEEEQEDRLVPLYSEAEGIKPTKLRAMIQKALLTISEEKEPSETLDWAPSWMQTKYNLMPRLQALKQVHQPPNEKGEDFLNYKSSAQERLIFDEFFWLELHLARRKSMLQSESAIRLQATEVLAEQLKASLPFELTGAQLRAYQEVTDDLKKNRPMHRLVQGDVGSGKTLVALMAVCYVAELKHQSAIMVPTEILAEQHYKNAKELLEPLGIRVALLTGSTKTAERQAILTALQAGEVDLCVGTHALIQETVAFESLSLVVIDEQHRFGVEQRQKLKQKGHCPHFLVMTATPIPRSLAMTVYGDLDVSIIDELPKGRQAILTRQVFDNKRPKVLGFMREQIQKGRQAYIVYPLVEESDKIELKNAEDEYKKLVEQFSEIRFGLLHGKMKNQEKDLIMKAFRNKEIDVLVATTVIEVGVDVPNANMMVIEHAERFGLSQLHQLRGRVGRGAHKSYCVLILGYAVSDESRERAQIMEHTSDGFKVAEADLELRGPGEFLGSRQSGLPGFKLANLVRDIKVLKKAREAAFELVNRDPQLKKTEHVMLSEIFNRKSAELVG